MKKIFIGKKQIGQSQPVFIIAEAGINHNGSLKLAKRLVDAAKAAGADAVKFQTFKAEGLVTRKAPCAKYQLRTVSGNSQFAMLKALELSEKDFISLSDYCGKKRIMFLSTPFDPQSARFLYRLGVSAFKVSSGDLTNTPLLSQVARYRRPVILSTGMATMEEVAGAVKAIYSEGNKNLILLHCTSNYPAVYDEVNLNALITLRRRFNIPVGYSDHTPGIEISIAAAAVGACLIEKHFTLNKSSPGPDHKASLDPDEFSRMVCAIRNAQEAMGDGIKKPQKAEEYMKKVARKSVVTARHISKGARITLDMLCVKRPGTGIAPKFMAMLIGRRASSDIERDKVLSWKDVSK